MDLVQYINIYHANDIDKILTIPIASHISYYDNDDNFFHGGFLASINKKSFTIIQDLSDPDTCERIYFSNISKLYVLLNRKTYLIQYKKNNKERIKKWNKDYYENKKANKS